VHAILSGSLLISHSLRQAAAYFSYPANSKVSVFGDASIEKNDPDRKT
jgi:hypothetical protein